jgi:glycosyltransferase involved in cell wall biosynthesis
MVVHLTRELRRLGIQTSVVSFFEPGGSQLQRELELDGVPVWSPKKRLGPDFGMIANLRTLIGRLRPEVIHTHLSTIRYAVPAVMGMTSPPRIVHTIHRVAERDSEPGLRWLQRWCLRRCGEVVAVSEEVALSCARLYRQRRISVVPNGIPLHKSDSATISRSLTRRDLGIENKSFVFCCVARMRAIKNHKTLLLAFAGIAGNTDAHLLLAGDGELRGELETLSRTLKITGRTHFLGERDDVAEVLAASDAFVLASFSEGTPFSVLEAMAAGLPVIATSVGGLPEIIRHGNEGWLVAPGQVEALRNAMARIVFDDYSRGLMTRAARERVRQRFDVGVMVQSYLSLYHRVGLRATMGTA